MEEIVGHDWRNGQVHFRCRWSGGDVTWESLRDMKEDYPRLTAQYMVENKISWSKRGGDRALQWAKKVLRDLDCAVRRITN